MPPCLQRHPAADRQALQQAPAPHKDDDLDVDDLRKGRIPEPLTSVVTWLPNSVRSFSEKQAVFVSLGEITAAVGLPALVFADRVVDKISETIGSNGKDRRPETFAGAIECMVRMVVALPYAQVHAAVHAALPRALRVRPDSTARRALASWAPPPSPVARLPKNNKTNFNIVVSAVLAPVPGVGILDVMRRILVQGAGSESLRVRSHSSLPRRSSRRLCPYAPGRRPRHVCNTLRSCPIPDEDPPATSSRPAASPHSFLRQLLIDWLLQFLISEATFRSTHSDWRFFGVLGLQFFVEFTG